eukprot:355341-Chlamydomonas_euryale.AAC.2
MPASCAPDDLASVPSGKTASGGTTRSLIAVMTWSVGCEAWRGRSSGWLRRRGLAAVHKDCADLKSSQLAVPKRRTATDSSAYVFTGGSQLPPPSPTRPTPGCSER